MGFFIINLLYTERIRWNYFYIKYNNLNSSAPIIKKYYLVLKINILSFHLLKFQILTKNWVSAKSP